MILNDLPSSMPIPACSFGRAWLSVPRSLCGWLVLGPVDLPRCHQG